jgi:hypothetical protein
VEVHAVVARLVIVFWLAAVIAVPDGVQFVSRSRALTFDLLDQLRTDWPGVAREPVLGDPECGEDQRFLLVDNLGEIRKSASIEGSGIHVDVNGALCVYVGAGSS